jgi:hypothetical protein
LKRGLQTTLRVSATTYNKLHFLKQPYEQWDELLNRIASEYPEMQKKVAMLENILVDKSIAEKIRI